MLRKNKKAKHRLPTEEEFLEFIPVRNDFKWDEDKDGLVKIIVPKFNTKLGKSFCKTIKKDQHFTAKMDSLGSFVWKNCDGKKTVKDILKIVEKNFSKEENLKNRFILFLQQIQNLNYISFR